MLSKKYSPSHPITMRIIRLAHVRITLHPYTRSFTVSSHVGARRSRQIPDETSISGAQHKPSLSGPSLGHLISELSATTPEMIKQGLRKEGETVAEADRTRIRRLAFTMGAIPMIVAGAYLVSSVMDWNNDDGKNSSSRSPTTQSHR